MSEMVNISIETWGKDLDVERLEDLGPALVDLGALGVSTSGGGIAGGPGATFSVRTEGPSEDTAIANAVLSAIEIFNRACERVGLDHGGVAHVDLMDDDYLDRWLNQEPETYLGVSEVADLLDVSKQRVSELRKTRSGFPEPVADLAAGPVWALSNLRRFIDEWPRRAGRRASWETDTGLIREAAGRIGELEDELSRRDVQLLSMLSTGSTTRDIAHDLGLSPEAARSAIRRMVGKLTAVVPVLEEVDEERVIERRVDA